MLGCEKQGNCALFKLTHDDYYSYGLPSPALGNKLILTAKSEKLFLIFVRMFASLE